MQPKSAPHSKLSIFCHIVSQDNDENMFTISKAVKDQLPNFTTPYEWAIVIFIFIESTNPVNNLK